MRPRCVARYWSSLLCSVLHPQAHAAKLRAQGKLIRITFSSSLSLPLLRNSSVKSAQSELGAQCSDRALRLTWSRRLASDLSSTSTSLSISTSNLEPHRVTLTQQCIIHIHTYIIHMYMLGGERVIRDTDIASTKRLRCTGGSRSSRPAGECVLVLFFNLTRFRPVKKMPSPLPAPPPPSAFVVEQDARNPLGCVTPFSHFTSKGVLSIRS